MKERRFEEVIDFLEGPGILARDFREDGIPLVRLAGLNPGASILEGCDYLDPEQVERRWAHFRLAKGDVLLSTSASLGRVAVVGKDGVGAIPYTGIIRMRPRDDSLYAPFIRYLLESPDFQRQTEMVGDGSVIRHFGPTHLKQMTVRLPPLPEQRAIASILGKLDEKIELNQRLHSTVDETTQALFQSWFIDFDPVRAKATSSLGPASTRISRERAFEMVRPDDRGLGQVLTGGRVGQHIAALFPDALEDSDLGSIPKGWKVVPLDKIATFQNGLALQKYRPQKNDDWLPVVKIAQLLSVL